MTPEERSDILDTYKWVKVPKYVDDESISWEERYQRLNDHHIKETTFLIEKIRSIVATEVLIDPVI